LDARENPLAAIEASRSGLVKMPPSNFVTASWTLI
jgi:hypothetical protein